MAIDTLTLWRLTFICAHCGDFAEVPSLTVEVLDSGTTLTCDECGRATIVDLSTSEERAKLFQSHVIDSPSPAVR